MNSILSDTAISIPLRGVQRDRPTVASSVETSFVDAATWSGLLVEFEDVSFEQTAAYVGRRWGNRSISQLLVTRDGEIIGGACSLSLNLPYSSAGLVYLKHGPIWRRRNRALIPENYRIVLSEIVAEFGGRRGYGIVVVPRPNPNANSIELSVLNELGFHTRRANYDPNRFLVDVALDEAVQLGSLSQKWRYNLRKAIKNGVEVAEAADAEAAQTFTALHASMVSRKRYADRDPVDLIPTLMAELPLELRPHIFVARHQGKAVAGAVVGVHGDTAYYLFGASNDEALPLKAGYALQWSITQWLRGTSAKWYDLGGEAGEPGLSQFKRGLVGRQGVIVSAAGEYEYLPTWRAQLAASIVMGIRDVRRRISTTLSMSGVQ